MEKKQIEVIIAKKFEGVVNPAQTVDAAGFIPTPADVSGHSAGVSYVQCPFCGVIFTYPSEVIFDKLIRCPRGCEWMMI